MFHQALKISVGYGLIVFSLTACSASIQVKHRDPTHQRVQVNVDNDKIKNLDYGDDMSVSVSEGTHQITAVPMGEKSSPWTADGNGWTIWVEKDAILTLLPPPETAMSE